MSAEQILFAGYLVTVALLIKTNGYDKPVIAKSNRVRDNARGIRKVQFRPITGTRASGIKLPMKPFARPIDRDTGREF